VAHQAHLSRDLVVVTVSKKGLSMKLIAGILSHLVDIKSRAPCLHSDLPKHGNMFSGPARVAHQARRSRDFVTVTVSKKGLSMKLIAGILLHHVDVKSRASCLHSDLPKRSDVLLGPACVSHRAHRSRDFVTVTVSKKGLSMKLIAGI
jgi:hypothetical protein